MKHLLTLLFGFALVAPLRADLDDPAFLALLTPPASACATTDTSIACDELLEGFQTPTTAWESAWTITGTDLTTNATFTLGADTTALTTNKPAGACDRALRVEIATGNSTESYYTLDRGSAIDLDTSSTDIVLWIYVATSQPVGEGVDIFCGTLNAAPNSTEVFSVNFNNSSGTSQVRVRGSDAPAYTTVPTGQWVRINIHLNTTAASSYYNVNGGSNVSFTRGANDLRYLSVGTTVARSTADTHDIYYDLICVNTP